MVRGLLSDKLIVTAMHWNIWNQRILFFNAGMKKYILLMSGNVSSAGTTATKFRLLLRNSDYCYRVFLQ